jgi:hypothetical protein
MFPIQLFFNKSLKHWFSYIFNLFFRKFRYGLQDLLALFGIHIVLSPLVLYFTKCLVVINLFSSSLTLKKSQSVWPCKDLLHQMFMGSVCLLFEWSIYSDWHESETLTLTINTIPKFAHRLAYFTGSSGPKKYVLYHLGSVCHSFSIINTKCDQLEELVGNELIGILTLPKNAVLSTENTSIIYLRIILIP